MSNTITITEKQKRCVQRIIASDLSYEKAQGIHIYSPCECGRQGKCNNFCALCLQEALDDAKGCLDKASWRSKKIIEEIIDWNIKHDTEMWRLLGK